MTDRLTKSLFRYVAPRWLQGGVVLVVLFCLGVTLFKQFQLGRADRQIEQEQARLVEEALEVVQADFRSTQEDLIRKARQVAQRRDVIEALERYTFSADPASREWLVSFFCEL